MKKNLCVLILSFAATFAFAQVNIKEVTHYLFKDFTKGTVLMKTGVKNEAMLNYNSLTEEMIFDNKGTKLALGNLELIDTVFINDRKFILLNRKFVEVIFESKFSLYAEHKCKLKDPGKPSAYGGTSQTSATSTYSTYFSGGQAYNLKLPEGFETNPYIEYWLFKDGKLNKFLSIRQLSKYFSQEEDIFKDFVKKNNVKFDDESSIVRLLKYLENN